MPTTLLFTYYYIMRSQPFFRCLLPVPPVRWLAGPPGSAPAQPLRTADPAPHATLEELTRDLAGWSLPRSAPASAGLLGAQWVW